MKALVTGGAGFIGSNLVDQLLEEGNQVVVIDNESADSNEQFYWNNLAENYKYDICDYERIAPLFEGIDVVFHLAAEARIQIAIKNPLLATRTNVLGTCNVLQASREAGVKRVIYSSTSSAYGLANKPPLKENMQRDCLNLYSVTKCAGEDLSLMYNRIYGLETVVLRYFNVYGERQPLKGQYAPVIGIFMRQSAVNEPMTIVGDGEQRRDFTHISDAVRANVLAANLENSRCVGEVFNIGTSINYNMFDLVKIIGGDHIHIPPRIGESRETLADIHKAKKILDWKPRINLEKWIKQQL
jgi:UDP-glucose 4-epimerase